MGECRKNTVLEKQKRRDIICGQEIFIQTASSSRSTGGNGSVKGRLVGIGAIGK